MLFKKGKLSSDHRYRITDSIYTALITVFSVHIVDLLKENISQSGLSIEDVADKLHIQTRKVRDYIAGYINPSLEDFLKIIIFFKISPDNIFSDPFNDLKDNFEEAITYVFDENGTIEEYIQKIDPIKTSRTAINDIDKKIRYHITEWNPTNEIIKQSVSFTGHRPSKYDYGSADYSLIRNRTYKEIQNAIMNGYEWFLTGGCSGFDILALDYCMKLKQQFGYDIKTVCVLPYEFFYRSNHFDSDWKNWYVKIINKCDYVTNPSGAEDFTANSQYMDRNKFLCDYSSLLIAMNPLKSGGTNNTVSYAKNKGLKVIDVS